MGQATNSGIDGSGANSYGYKFNCSTNWAGTGANTNPAVYDWIDISATGTRITGLGDDNIVGPIPLGFNFKYFWNTYNSVNVGSNGYIMFGDNALIAQGQNGMPTIPFASDGKGNFIAAMLSDLTFINHATSQTLPGAKILYQTIDSLFVITYDSVRFWNNTPASGPEEASGMNSFQIILHQNSNNVRINYKKSEGPWFTGSTGVMSCGAENITGQFGMRWRRKAAASVALPPATSAVKITYPTTSTYSFRDIQAKAIFTPDNKGGTAFTNIPKTMTAYVRNSGTTKITTPVNTRLIVTDINDEPIFNNTVIIDSLQLGEERVINFPQLLIPTDTAGSYKATLTTTTNPANFDQYSANNTQITKLVVLDSTNGSVDLKFTNPLPGTVSNTNQSPNAGMVFDPPYQPMVIKKISVDMIWPDADGWANTAPNVGDSLTNTRIEVFIGDGPNGAIGTLLDSFTIATPNDYEPVIIGEEVVSGTLLNRIIRFNRTLPTPIQWFNGARIYVGAIHNNATRFVWNAPYSEVYKPGFPASGRALEIAGGVYGENRGKDSIDVGVGLIGDPLAVAVSGIVKLPVLSLDQNIPNPATVSTSISYVLPKEGLVSISLKDALGREVLSKSANGTKGTNKETLSLTGLKPAVYFYTVSHESGSATKRLIVK